MNPQIEFEHFGRNFLFPIHKLNMDTSDGKNIPDANFYTGISDNLICNVVKYNETYCVQVFDCSQSIAKRKLDASNNFTITYGNNIKNQLKDISSAILKTNILFAYKYNFIVLPGINIVFQFNMLGAPHSPLRKHKRS